MSNDKTPYQSGFQDAIRKAAEVARADEAAWRKENATAIANAVHSTAFAIGQIPLPPEVPEGGVTAEPRGEAFEEWHRRVNIGRETHFACCDPAICRAYYDSEMRGGT